MRIPLIIAAAVMLQPAHGLSEILYARPDTEVAGARYRWRNDIVRASVRRRSAFKVTPSVNGARALEIRLLHASGTQETIYSRRSRQPSNRSEVAGFRERGSSSFEGSSRGRPRKAERSRQSWDGP